MKNLIWKSEDMEKAPFTDIKKLTEKVFKGTSKNYRQKLVYNLLNTVKSNDQKEFFWMFLRALNARGDSNAEKLSDEISKFYPPHSSTFEKIAYSVILGILSVKSEGGE